MQWHTGRAVASVRNVSHAADDAEARATALARVDRLFSSNAAAIADVRRDPGVRGAVQVAALHHPDPHIRRS